MRKLSKKREKELIAKFGHVLSKEEFFERLKVSQERLIQSLGGALATAPDDPKIRADLLAAVDKAVKMRKKVYQMIGENPPQIKLDTHFLDEEEDFPLLWRLEKNN